MAEVMVAERQQVLSDLPKVQGQTSITFAAPASRISLRAKQDALPALSGALGVDLPNAPKTSARQGTRHALWLGPDEWLLIDETGADLMAVLKSAGVMHSATDVSHRNNAFLVSGTAAADVLNAGCALNLSLSAFPVGACTRTIFGKAEIVLYRTGEDAFRVECWRSFAEFVQGLLLEGAKDI